MEHNVKSLLLLLIVSVQSCSMCMHQKAKESDVVEDSVLIREPWSTLNEVGYPVVTDTIPSIILERYCYSVSYNPETRQPNWVMWQLTGEHVMTKKEGI